MMKLQTMRHCSAWQHPRMVFQNAKKINEIQSNTQNITQKYIATADTKAPDAKAAVRHLVRKRKREFPEPAAIRARQVYCCLYIIHIKIHHYIGSPGTT